MSRSTNTPLLVSLVACILVVVGAMMTAVLIAVQRPVVIVMPSSADAELAPAAAVLQTQPLASAGVAPAVAPPAPAAASATGAAPAAPPADQPQIQCVRVAAVPALDDVFAAAWDAAPPVEIPLQPQQTAPPMLAQATIPSVTVQAVRDDERVAWRLSWAEPTPEDRADAGVFPDGVAVQFQMVDGAPFTMGAKDMPVRILHWKSVWQKDVDEGFQDLTRLYPNAWNDLYWFAGVGPVPIAQIASSPEARQFQVGLSAGNPMIKFDRTVPVEELVAEGFGTATDVPDTPSTARGAWKDGRWTVVIDRPLRADDPLAARLTGSPEGSAISLAVWDGSAGNRGGLKHWCAWIPMRIEQ